MKIYFVRNQIRTMQIYNIHYTSAIFKAVAVNHTYHRIRRKILSIHISIVPYFERQRQSFDDVFAEQYLQRESSVSKQHREADRDS